MEQGFFTLIFTHMAIVWIALAIVFAVIEGLTFGLVTIWFTVGAVVSAVVALLGGGIPLQLTVFFAVSIILLIFTRPILVKHLKVGREKNNIEMIEGKRGLVTEAIEPFKSGLVKVNGVVWTAVGDTQEVVVDIGQEVEIVRVEGVKLIVTPASNKPPA
ncbi:MAG: NfeD family protein [Clostridiales Family XIII bacterium]|jgi:membrane protein implicated in regulation of membrane protease activity|nr:NfeD family protein [Clostridiales Family XIII bacterium]